MTLYVRQPPLDTLEADGAALVMLPDARVVRLSPVATAVFRLTAQPRDPAWLAAAVEESLGPPPGGTTLSAVRAVIAELADLGMLVEHGVSGERP